MSNAAVSRRTFLQTTSLAAAGAVLAEPSAARGEASQTNPSPAKASNPRIQTPDVVEFQLRQYLMKRIPPLPKPKDAAKWTAEARRLRIHLLDNVILHGWPREWIESRPRFEDLGLIPSGKGYRLRKLRYEIVPGFWTTALLYEPENPRGKAPATINLNGHDPGGKAAPYKQIRCINNARQGMFALSLEWLGMGEMRMPENDHWNGGHLNLVGASATGLFYLAIRRGLDYLCEHPGVDASRIGATGLSGGAWQTIIISALDERIAACVPVAGYFSFTSAVERNSDVGDMEYHPHDLFAAGGDYSTLTAMLAPHPALLIYGATDEYGLRAPMQKSHLYDEVKPFYELYGKPENFAWHENVDPGTHNYELDNRQQSYAFFTRHFGIPLIEREIDVRPEVKDHAALDVGVTEGNLTILGLAKKFAAEIKRSPIPAEKSPRDEWVRTSRAHLRDLVRFTPVTVKHAWPVFSDRRKGIATLAHCLQFSNDLTATAISMKSATAPPDAPVVILLNDAGVEQLRPTDDVVSQHIARGEHVLAVNLLFTGDASPDLPKGEAARVPEQYREAFPPAVLADVMDWLVKTRPPSALYSLLLSAAGDRPLGMRAAQLIGIAGWLRELGSVRSISIETVGIRSQISGLIACALEPSCFADISVREGTTSLGHLLDHAVRFQDAPELFCLDLYREFDIDALAALGEPRPHPA